MEHGVFFKYISSKWSQDITRLLFFRENTDLYITDNLKIVTYVQKIHKIAYIQCDAIR